MVANYQQPVIVSMIDSSSTQSGPSSNRYFWQPTLSLWLACMHTYIHTLTRQRGRGKVNVLLSRIYQQPFEAHDDILLNDLLHTRNIRYLQHVLQCTTGALYHWSVGGKRVTWSGWGNRSHDHENKPHRPNISGINIALWIAKGLFFKDMDNGGWALMMLCYSTTMGQIFSIAKKNFNWYNESGERTAWFCWQKDVLHWGSQ